MANSSSMTRLTIVLTADAGAGSQALSLSGGWVSHRIPVRSGSSYIASALVKSSGSSGWSGAGIDFVDDNGTKLADAVQTINASNNYGQLSITGSAPAAATTALFWFYADAPRTSLVDAVDFRESGCP